LSSYAGAVYEWLVVDSNYNEVQQLFPLPEAAQTSKEALFDNLAREEVGNCTAQVHVLYHSSVCTDSCCAVAVLQASTSYHNSRAPGNPTVQSQQLLLR
jgi:hypothetical protein